MLKSIGWKHLWRISDLIYDWIKDLMNYFTFTLSIERNFSPQDFGYKRTKSTSDINTRCSSTALASNAKQGIKMKKTQKTKTVWQEMHLSKWSSRCNSSQKTVQGSGSQNAHLEDVRRCWLVLAPCCGSAFFQHLMLSLRMVSYFLSTSGK